MEEWKRFTVCHWSDGTATTTATATTTTNAAMIAGSGARQSASSASMFSNGAAATAARHPVLNAAAYAPSSYTLNATHSLSGSTAVRHSGRGGSSISRMPIIPSAPPPLAFPSEQPDRSSSPPSPLSNAVASPSIQRCPMQLLPASGADAMTFPPTAHMMNRCSGEDDDDLADEEDEDDDWLRCQEADRRRRDLLDTEGGDDMLNLPPAAERNNGAASVTATVAGGDMDQFSFPSKDPDGYAKTSVVPFTPPVSSSHTPPTPLPSSSPPMVLLQPLTLSPSLRAVDAGRNETEREEPPPLPPANKAGMTTSGEGEDEEEEEELQAALMLSPTAADAQPPLSSRTYLMDIVLARTDQQKHAFLCKMSDSFRHAYAYKRALLLLFRDRINRILEYEGTQATTPREARYFLELEATLTQVGSRQLRYFYPQCVTEATDPEAALEKLQGEWAVLLERAKRFLGNIPQPAAAAAAAAERSYASSNASSASTSPRTTPRAASLEDGRCGAAQGDARLTERRSTAATSADATPPRRSATSGDGNSPSSRSPTHHNNSPTHTIMSPSATAAAAAGTPRKRLSIEEQLEQAQQRQQLWMASTMVQSMELFERYHPLQAAVREAQRWVEWYYTDFPAWDAARRARDARQEEQLLQRQQQQHQPQRQQHEHQEQSPGSPATGSSATTISADAAGFSTTSDSMTTDCGGGVQGSRERNGSGSSMESQDLTATATPSDTTPMPSRSFTGHEFTMTDEPIPSPSVSAAATGTNTTPILHAQRCPTLSNTTTTNTTNTACGTAHQIDHETNPSGIPAAWAAHALRGVRVDEEPQQPFRSANIRVPTRRSTTTNTNAMSGGVESVVPSGPLSRAAAVGVAPFPPLASPPLRGLSAPPPSLSGLPVSPFASGTSPAGGFSLSPRSTPAVDVVVRQLQNVPFPRMSLNWDAGRFSADRQAVEMLRLQRKVVMMYSANEELRRRKEEEEEEEKAQQFPPLREWTGIDEMMDGEEVF